MASRTILAILLLTITMIGLYRPLVLSGFAEAGDFILAFSAQMLADLGLDRLPIAGALGGPELEYALNHTPPITLAAQSLFFHLFGDRPSAQMGVMLLLHLLNSLLMMWLVWLWRRRFAVALFSGFLLALHPLVVGALHSLGSISTLLATFWILLTALLGLAYQHQGWRALISLMLLTSLIGAACDPLGLIGIPLVLYTSLTFPERNRSSQSRPWMATAVVAVGSILPLFYIAHLIQQTLYLTPLLSLRWADITVDTAWYQIPLNIVATIIGYSAYLARGLFAPCDFSLGTSSEWFGYLLIALVTAMLLTLTILKSFKRPAVLFWPLLLLLAMVPHAYQLSLPNPTAPSQAFAGLYLPLTLAAIWLSDLASDIDHNRRLAVFLLLPALLLLPQSLMLVHTRANQSRLVNGLGREINALIERAPMGADVIIPAKPTRMNLVEAAFLAGQYASPFERQIRFRMLVGGHLLADVTGQKLGREYGAWVRLPYQSRNLVLGLTADQLHFMDLTSLIETRIKQAEDSIKQTLLAPPMWTLIDETSPTNWLMEDPGDKPRLLDPSRLGWYLEGFFYRLHPRLGRVGY